MEMQRSDKSDVYFLIEKMCIKFQPMKHFRSNESGITAFLSESSNGACWTWHLTHRGMVHVLWTSLSEGLERQSDN